VTFCPPQQHQQHSQFSLTIGPPPPPSIPGLPPGRDATAGGAAGEGRRGQDHLRRPGAGRRRL
jgi:hypothetical protein